MHVQPVNALMRHSCRDVKSHGPWLTGPFTLDIYRSGAEGAGAAARSVLLRTSNYNSRPSPSTTSATKQGCTDPAQLRARSSPACAHCGAAGMLAHTAAQSRTAACTAARCPCMRVASHAGPVQLRAKPVPRRSEGLQHEYIVHAPKHAGRVHLGTVADARCASMVLSAIVLAARSSLFFSAWMQACTPQRMAASL